MELTDRQKQILRAIVDIYVSTAEPVGSKAIAALPDMKFSSATIRNEMADLTQMGYLVLSWARQVRWVEARSSRPLGRG